MRSVPFVKQACLGGLQVARNRPNIQSGEDAMGFGQIIALVPIFGNVVDVVMVVRERHRRKFEGHSFLRIPS